MRITKRHPLWALAALFVFCTPAGLHADARPLLEHIEAIAAQAQGRVGVAAVVLETGASVELDGDGRYPMQSVYKLPIAMAVLRAIDFRELDRLQSIRVGPDDYVLRPQHSPLRDRHPEGVDVTIEELMRLAVAESDGTASDVLLQLLGGPEEVMEFLGSIGISGVQIIDTERAIGADEAVQYRNWATPRAAVAFLRALHECREISARSRALLLRWTTETTSGKRRLKALLPPGTVVAHKTGSSVTVDGVTAATNDIGLITLPEGHHLAVAVFVSDSRADAATRDAVIAGIAKAIWDEVTRTP